MSGYSKLSLNIKFQIHFGLNVCYLAPVFIVLCNYYDCDTFESMYLYCVYVGTYSSQLIRAECTQ